MIFMDKKNVNEYVNKTLTWIREYVESANAKGVVLGMSGGIDCSVVARLCQMAGVDVHLAIMPYGDNMTTSGSYNDAMELINKFKFKYHVHDIKPAVDAEQTDLSLARNDQEKKKFEFANANVRPRIRMTHLYNYAQAHDLLVVGTGNLSEILMGYSTKWGDAASDFNPLGDFLKTQVYIIAEYIGIPEKIRTKAPSAELWPGQTDEDELGVSYSAIDSYYQYGTCGNEEKDKIIAKKAKASVHKRRPVPTPFPKERRTDIL